MAEGHRVPRSPDLEPPAQVLKLVGSPRPEETAAPSYSVHLELSRKLTAAEQDAAAAPLRSPAGRVQVGTDKKHLVVAETTIEQVGQHRDSLKAIVSKIATDGEEYRKRAVEERRSAHAEDNARQAEHARRQEAAKQIKFD